MLRRKDDPTDSDPNAQTTFFEIARSGIADDNEPGGRFAAAARVVGSTPNAGALYPAASVPNGDVGLEPPLNDDLHPGPVGEAHEIAASIAQLEQRLERQRDQIAQLERERKESE